MLSTMDAYYAHVKMPPQFPGQPPTSRLDMGLDDDIL